MTAEQLYQILEQEQERCESNGKCGPLPKDAIEFARQVFTKKFCAITEQVIGFTGNRPLRLILDAWLADPEAMKRLGNTFQIVDIRYVIEIWQANEQIKEQQDI